jgi:hypothetical protein
MLVGLIAANYFFLSFFTQVFFTREGKGWGLRTLDELPKGAFVCEYVGELLTNTELRERTSQKAHKAGYTYPVDLDAGCDSDGVLEDKEALCLDASFYGNVGRFINHRCALFPICSLLLFLKKMIAEMSLPLFFSFLMVLILHHIDAMMQIWLRSLLKWRLLIITITM